MNRAIVFSLALALAGPALARNVAGREFPEAIDVGGTSLVLNGAGVRRKLFFKVYAGALYLVSPSQDARAIVAADAPKCVRVVFLRTVGKEDLRQAYRAGFERNSPGADVAELVQKLDELSAALPNELKEGSEMQVTYLPGEGTTIALKDGTRAVVPGRDFAEAMFRNWLGDHPSDEKLKDAMLGR